MVKVKGIHRTLVGVQGISSVSTCTPARYGSKRKKTRMTGIKVDDFLRRARYSHHTGPKLCEDRFDDHRSLSKDRSLLKLVTETNETAANGKAVRSDVFS